MVLKIKLRLQNASGSAQPTPISQSSPATEFTPFLDLQGSENAPSVKQSSPLCSDGSVSTVPKHAAFPTYHVYPEPSLPSATSDTPNLSYDSTTSSRSSSVDLKTPASAYTPHFPTELGPIPNHLEALYDGSRPARGGVPNALDAKTAIESAQPEPTRANSLPVTSISGAAGHPPAGAKAPSQKPSNKPPSPNPPLQDTQQASGRALNELVLDVQRWPSLWSDLELPDPLSHQPMEGKSDTVVVHHFLTKQNPSVRPGLYPIFRSLRETLFKLDNGDPAHEALAPRFRDPLSSLSRISQSGGIVQYALLARPGPEGQYAAMRAESSWLRSYCYKLPKMTKHHSAFAADPATGQIGSCSGLCDGKAHSGGYYCRFCRGHITSNLKNSPIGKLWIHLVPTAAISPSTVAGHAQGWRYSCCPSLGAGEDALAFLGAIEELDRFPLNVAKVQTERRRLARNDAQRQKRVRDQMAMLTAKNKKKAKKGTQKVKASARKSTAAGKSSLSREVVLKAAVLASGGVIPQRGLSPLTPTKTMEADAKAMPTKTIEASAKAMSAPLIGLGISGVEFGMALPVVFEQKAPLAPPPPVSVHHQATVDTTPPAPVALPMVEMPSEARESALHPRQTDLAVPSIDGQIPPTRIKEVWEDFIVVQPLQ